MLHLVALRDTDLSPIPVLSLKKKECASASLGYDLKGVPLHTLSILNKYKRIYIKGNLQS